MPVQLVPPRAEDLYPVAGASVGGAMAAVRKPGRRDLVLLALDEGSKVAGVFTANRFTGRPRESAEGVLRWIPNAAVPRLPLWEGDRIFLKWLKRKKTFLGTFVYRKGRLASHRVSFY